MGEEKMTDKYRRKNLKTKDLSFNNRKATLITTQDVKKFVNEHVVWCPECNPKFTGMLLHAKTSDNKRMKTDCIAECKKIFEGKRE